jgi:hypothetical protein
MKVFASVVGLFTRLSCLLLGFGIPLVSIPLALLAGSVPQGEPFTPAWQLALFVIGCAGLIGAGFAMFAVGWGARFDRPLYRGVTFMLLLIPFALGWELMGSPVQFPLAQLAVALTVFTGWVLLLCVRPALLAPPKPAP